MATDLTSVERREDLHLSRSDTNVSGISWGAVVGGAFVAAALSLILLALGAGLGLSAVSPWSSSRVAASALDSTAIAWLIVTELLASAMGGYLAGRLRTKWATIHTDEVFFRDTASGFLAWAVSLVITVAFLSSAASSMVGSLTASEAMHGTTVDDAPYGYFVDALFRSDHQGPETTDRLVQGEATRIFGHSLEYKSVSSSDRSYLTRLVSAKTGLSQGDAEKRVSDVTTDAFQDAETLRKAVSRLLLWVFLALLIGAFSASYAATVGGRQRDHVKLV